MSLQERAALQIAKNSIIEQLANPDLGFLETITLKDELLEIEEQLGEFMRNAYSDSSECLNCGS